jgi:electron transfer flavoprotein alpha subunit
MHLLVAGDQTGNVAKVAASIAGIAKVLVADDKSLENGLAENLAPLMQSLSGGYSHMMAAGNNNRQKCYAASCCPA